MRSAPTSIELLEVVAAFLRDVAAPALAGGKRFHALVAANSLDIVAREIALGGTSDRDAEARLATLLGRQGPIATLDALLCDRIADGGLTLDDPALADHLLRSAAEEIAIDQPRYATAALLKTQDQTRGE